MPEVMLLKKAYNANIIESWEDMRNQPLLI